MRKALLALLAATLAAVSLAFAVEIDGTTITIEILGDGKLIDVDKKVLEVNFVGPTMMRMVDGSWEITGYLDGSVKKIKIEKGEVEVLKTYVTSYASDGIYDEVSDEDGNTYVACFAHNGENNDICTIKYDPTGQMAWVKIFDSGGKDISWSIGVDEDGNVYASGFVYNDDSDVRTIKYSPDGEVLWNQVFDSGKLDKPHEVSVDVEGNVCVECFTVGKGVHTIKYNADGELQ